MGSRYCHNTSSALCVVDAALKSDITAPGRGHRRRLQHLRRAADRDQSQIDGAGDHTPRDRQRTRRWRRATGHQLLAESGRVAELDRTDQLPGSTRPPRLLAILLE
jgi:hypothetical protein